MNNKIKIATIWVLLAGTLATTVILACNASKNVRVSAISVHISDNSNNKFISESDVIQVFEKEDIKLVGSLIDSVNLHSIEDILLHNNDKAG